MTNKRKVTNKQMASLGIKKNESGDYEYIDPEEKNRSKYNSVKKYIK